jgi:predicted nucleic acid-binding protein
MPVYSIAGFTLDISREAILLDTNVLVTAFQSGQSDHEEMRFFLDETDRQLLVATSVVVESWGMLSGSFGNRAAATEMIAWVNTPGRALLIPDRDEDLIGVAELIESLRIDCVDSIVLGLAKDITTRCGLNPSLAVASADRDFRAALYSGQFSLRLYDPIYDAMDEV